MKIKYLITLAFAFISFSVFSQSIDDLYNVGRALSTNKTVPLSDTVEVQFITNVPANLKLNDIDYGEVSSKPYHLKYGMYKVEISAKGRRTQTKTIELSRTQHNIYNFNLKEDNSIPFRKGLQQEIGLSHGVFGLLYSGLIDYTIGYRFNNWVFLGVGTGLYVYSYFSSKIDDWKTDDYIPYRYYEGWRTFEYIGLKLPDETIAQKKTISAEIPLYAQLKVYFTDTRWKPFCVTSVGGRFGLNKDKDVGALFNLGLGVEYRLTEQYSLNMSFGYQMKGQKIFAIDRQVDYQIYGTAVSHCTSSCPYYNSFHYHFRVPEVYILFNHHLMHGFFLHLGFVF